MNPWLAPLLHCIQAWIIIHDLAVLLWVFLKTSILRTGLPVSNFYLTNFKSGSSFGCLEFHILVSWCIALRLTGRTMGSVTEWSHAVMWSMLYITEYWKSFVVLVTLCWNVQMSIPVLVNADSNSKFKFKRLYLLSRRAAVTENDKFATLENRLVNSWFYCQLQFVLREWGCVS